MRHPLTYLIATTLSVAFVLVLGCGVESERSYVAGSVVTFSDEPVAKSAAPEFDLDIDGNSDGLVYQYQVLESHVAGETHEVAAETPPAIAGRKIIYTANVQIVVAELPKFLSEIRTLINDAGGFIGSSSESGINGANPTASLTIRVPSAGYSLLLNELDDLGTVEQRTESSSDVTAQYVDIEARIRNKQREELRLVDLLEDPDGKLTHILEVERELSRVRGEIERAQGQINVLNDQIDLATITISASERTVYTPPTQALFGDRISAAWSNSTSNLSEFATRATIEVVAFVPWLTVWIPLAFVAWLVAFVIRRRFRDLAKTDTPAMTT